MALTLIGLLVLNVATVTVQGVAVAVSGVVSAVAGASAILPEIRGVSYRGAPTKLASAVSDTTKRVAKRTARGAARNVSSVFAEALPVIGIGAVVGVTAWELKDGCETKKDLHELELAVNPAAGQTIEATTVCGLEVPSKEEVWTTAKSSPGKAWASAKTYVPDLPEWNAPEFPDLNAARQTR